MTAAVSSTPAERRREKMRASILQAAEHVFAAEGEEGLSIRRLAKEIDYSPAAIYKYFTSKEELIEELKEAFFQQIIEAAEDLDEVTGGYRMQARACLQRYVQIAIENPHHYAAAFSGTVETAHDPEKHLQSKKLQAFMILCNLVEEGQAAGVLRADVDTELAAKSLWASCHGIASLMSHLPDFPAFHPDHKTMSREDFLAFHVDQIMRGLELPDHQTAPSDIPPRIRTT